MSYTLAMLRERLPGYPWAEPLPVHWPDKTTLACRVCIANMGLKADSEHQFATEAEWREHFEETHE